MKSNPKRVPYSDKVKARVREMREMGYSNVQITEATGVPGSTIARWAAEGKWRVRDLVEEPEFNDPAGAPDGLLKDDGSFVRSRDPDGSHRTGSGLHAGNEDCSGSPELVSSRERSEAGDKHQNTLEQSRQERLEDALEKAAVAAEDAILRGNFAAAGKATQMADTLSRALERVRKSAPEEKREGVFYTAEDIARAREELTRRFDRLARTLRKDEMSPLQR